MDNEPDSNYLQNLRALAEARMQKNKQDIAQLSVGDIATLIHELETHQIELEMQNEDLRNAQEQIIEAQEQIIETRDQYAELYNFAPVGYLTLSSKGLILKTNLTASEMLQVPIASLINQPLCKYMDSEDQDNCYHYLKTVFKTKVKQH